MTKNFLHYIYIFLPIGQNKKSWIWKKKSKVKEIGMAFQDYSQVKETQKQFIPLS